ncbi:MAG: sporulation protein YabP [Clostridia bacterium]|nr:sporulation protein YabP [Clostridia bacterium]
MEEERKRHFISMENREKMTIDDVRDVESFDEERITVETTMGMLTVLGSDFRMHKLDVEDGQLVIEGWIDELKYSESRQKNTKGGVFARLFQ